MTTYQFNSGAAKHLFCATCGVKSFYVPRSHPDGYSVNARCLDDGTVEGMNVTPFDGRNWEDSARKACVHGPGLSTVSGSPTMRTRGTRGSRVNFSASLRQKM